MWAWLARIRVESFGEGTVLSWGQHWEVAVPCIFEAEEVCQVTWFEPHPVKAHQTELKCKGFDTYVVLSWLAQETSQNPPVSAKPGMQVALNEMRTCLWAADSWVGMLAHADMFFTEEEQLHKEMVGSIFLSMYISLAGRSLNLRERYWRTRPKFHLLDHCIHERRNSRLNPDVNSTCMDEDWVKRVMRTKKGTHKRTASEQSLRRWILGLGPKMVDALNKLRWE